MKRIRKERGAKAVEGRAARKVAPRLGGVLDVPHNEMIFFSAWETSAGAFFNLPPESKLKKWESETKGQRGQHGKHESTTSSGSFSLEITDWDIFSCARVQAGANIMVLIFLVDDASWEGLACLSHILGKKITWRYFPSRCSLFLIRSIHHCRPSCPILMTTGDKLLPYRPWCTHSSPVTKFGLPDFPDSQICQGL